MNSCELTASITALANALACKLSIDEISLLASSLVQLGDTLATIALQRTLCENSKETTKS
ncbi:MAG: hypothetical protein E7393_05295 [Ruminococcaceae bacterium]|nr:hypothetical protein [Oscillospiraceae bacterium]